MEKAAVPWSAPVAVEEIPDTGLHVAIEAPVEARGAIARIAGLRDLPAVTAEFDLERRGSDVAVSGRVRACVGQTCVVTLDPIENEIDEPISLIFSPATAGDASASAPGASEPPEALVDGRIDLGALTTEFLLLAIDPYPRKPGAAFATPKTRDEGEKPFAALEALKKRLGGGD